MKEIIKKMVSAVMMVTLILAVAGCGNGSAQKEAPQQAPAAAAPAAPKQGGRTLVVYFSATGNTQKVAETIAKETGADLFRIEPAEPYTAADLNYNDKQSRVVKEHANPDLRPACKGDVAGWDQYDTVFIGFPHWWRQAPHVVYTFVEKHDFTGKKVIPFATSMSTPMGDSGTNLAKAAKTGSWQAGQRFAGGVMDSEVISWVKGLK